MRILNIVGAFPPAFVHGGPVYTTYHLSKALMALGHEVFVLTTDICGEERLDVPSHDTSWQGVPVRYCRWVKSPIPYHSPELGKQVSLRASEFDIALINSCWTGYGAMAGRQCRQAKLPYLMYPHGSYAPLRLQKGYLKKKLWWWLLDRHLYNSSNGIVALTRAEINEIRAMGVRVPITHIPNGVDVSEFENALSRQQLEGQISELEGKKYVLFLGRFDPIKGIDMLVSVFSQVAAQFSDLLLVLAGPDERGYRRVIEELVVRYGLKKRVLFPGMVRGALKAGLMQAAEVFVLPSKGEGMSIATLEAMACGTPVLITKECNLPEVNDFGAGMVVEREENQLTFALKRLLSEQKLVLTMGQQAHQLVLSHFTWQQVAAQTVELCRKVIA